MRSVCRRCLRPSSDCYCPYLPSLQTQLRVVFLQHSRERRVPVGTCRMAHLSLPNSELHVGVRFEDHPRVQALVGRDDVALLYPTAETGPGAARTSASAKNESAAPAEVPPPPLTTLVVIDGTWINARKVLERNPSLQTFRRVGLRPTAPGNYRIRREPAPHCLSTIEAVAEALGQLEGRPAEFRRLLEPFTFMVERQLSYAHAKLPSSRRRRTRPHGPRPPS